MRYCGFHSNWWCKTELVFSESQLFHRLSRFQQSKRLFKQKHNGCKDNATPGSKAWQPAGNLTVSFMTRTPCKGRWLLCGVSLALLASETTQQWNLFYEWLTWICCNDVITFSIYLKTIKKTITQSYGAGNTISTSASIASYLQCVQSTFQNIFQGYVNRRSRPWLFQGPFPKTHTAVFLFCLWDEWWVSMQGFQ